jgi:DNA processing protein
MDERLYWVGFNLVRGIGAVRTRALLERFGSLKAAWSASLADLRDAGLGPKTAARLIAARSGVDLEALWSRIEDQGFHVLLCDDDGYPTRLKQIEQPPPVLYLRGALEPGDDFAVAVVGTRKATAYGRQVAQQVAAHLASAGITIVSGLARGIDALAHAAALDAGGRTVAVLGSGLDRIYPPENRRLADRIAAQGALISEYALGTAPESSNFPPRNRIISGLCMATVVVEAGDTSGALITAEFAADQGRDVFAVPGNINAAQSRGTNRLVRDGAFPLLEAADVLRVLNLSNIDQHTEARRSLPADELERMLFDALGHNQLHVDEIRNQTGLPMEKVSATLVMMELKGLVRQVGAMQYVAVREVQSGYPA